MKKAKISLLFVVLALLLVLPAQADTGYTAKNYATYDGDEVANPLPTKGSYGTVAATASVTVGDDGTGNLAYKLSGGSASKEALFAYTYASTSAVQNKLKQADFCKADTVRMQARVKLSSSVGMTNLFSLNRTMSSSTLTVSGCTAGVMLKSGGASYYDVEEGEYVNFVEDDTMSVDTWYTVEAYFDFRQATTSDSTSKVLMCAKITDIDGNLVGQSDWAVVSTLTKYKDATSYPRAQITFEAYPEDAYTYIDDIMLDILTLDEIVADVVPSSDYSSVNVEFGNELDESTISKDSVIVTYADDQTVDLSDIYSVSYADSAIIIAFDEIKYSTNYNITLKSTIKQYGALYSYNSDFEHEFTTPKDPISSSMETVSFSADTGTVTAGSQVTAAMTLNNTTFAQREYMLIITSWNSRNECVAVRNVYGKLDAGESIDLTLPPVTFEDGESKLIVSVIDNWNDMTPAGDAVVFTLQQ